MPHQAARWIEITVLIVIAIYLVRPRRKPPTHPLPSGDAALLLRRLFARRGKRIDPRQMLS
ncbi:MAG: hypothetical protein ABSB15_15310 [Bryobacteraceae bacterium]|jgi:hypothetical protein